MVQIFKKIFKSQTNFKYLDNFFTSTHPDMLAKKFRIRYHFLPTPVDKNIEKLNIYAQDDYTHDVFCNESWSK